MTTTMVKLSTNHVLKGLDELRDRKLLCDVHLVVEGAKFPAHVLAAASPYFQAMFTGGFKENQMNEITLNDTSSVGLKCVLDAIYTAKLSLSAENVCDILPLASQLQLNQIVEHCGRFLSRNITTQTCLGFLSTAEKYDFQEAVNKCNKFVLENFDIISQLTEFENLSKEQLCTYISVEYLKAEKGEIEVFRAALKWYGANQKGGDSSDLADLMQHVRFPLIPSNLLLKEILACRLISENPKVMKLVTEALQFQSNDNIFLQPLQEGKQFKPRGEQMLALLYSTFRSEGQSLTAVKTKLCMINGTNSKPFQIQFSEQALTVALCPGNLSLISKGNYLFLFGADVEYIRAVTMRFDVTKTKWMNLQPPPQRASIRMAATSLEGNIYLLGGMNLMKGKENAIDPSNFSSSVSQYSIETNSWSQLQNLPRPVAFHSAASRGNYVFCAGGYIQNLEYTDKLYAFDIVGKIWLTKASMNSTRTRFRMEAVCGKLVACGGEEAANVEIYDIADNQWTLIQNGILEHHVNSATIVLNDRVYVIGGSSRDEDGTYCLTDYVNCVDVENGYDTQSVQSSVWSSWSRVCPTDCSKHNC